MCAPRAPKPGACLRHPQRRRAQLARAPARRPSCSLYELRAQTRRRTNTHTHTHTRTHAHARPLWVDTHRGRACSTGACLSSCPAALTPPPVRQELKCNIVNATTAVRGLSSSCARRARTAPTVAAARHPREPALASHSGASSRSTSTARPSTAATSSRQLHARVLPLAAGEGAAEEKAAVAQVDLHLDEVRRVPRSVERTRPPCRGRRRAHHACMHAANADDAHVQRRKSSRAARGSARAAERVGAHECAVPWPPAG